MPETNPYPNVITYFLIRPTTKPNAQNKLFVYPKKYSALLTSEQAGLLQDQSVMVLATALPGQKPQPQVAMIRRIIKNHYPTNAEPAPKPLQLLNVHQPTPDEKIAIGAFLHQYRKEHAKTHVKSQSTRTN